MQGYAKKHERWSTGVSVQEEIVRSSGKGELVSAISGFSSLADKLQLHMQLTGSAISDF